jgi:hypothetical protein
MFIYINIYLFSWNIRILITNQHQYFEGTDKILVLWDDKFISQVSYNDLKEKGFDFAQYMIKKKVSDDLKMKYKKVSLRKR